MPNTNSITKNKGTYKHLTETERTHIERWLRENKSQAEISRLLDRNPSTISREIKRGTVKQIKSVSGYYEEVEEYYAETGQAIYDKNRKRSKSKGLKAFSDKFWDDLDEANNEGVFSGKNRTDNLKTFTVVYQRENPSEKVPVFKTVYNYVHRGDFFIKPIDLPVMVTLKPRKNKNSRPKGTNKRKLGKSISERPETVLKRESTGHWEADLVQGKKGKDEPVVLTLVDRLSRYAVSRKLMNAKSDTVQEALLDITKVEPEAFDSITFDNGSEFSQAGLLEEESVLDLKIYFCHAYSSWERGSNENFNKLLREFLPKGKSMHHFTDQEVSKAAHKINQRVREVNDYLSAEELYSKMKK